MSDQCRYGDVLGNTAAFYSQLYKLIRLVLQPSLLLLLQESMHTPTQAVIRMSLKLLCLSFGWSLSLEIPVFFYALLVFGVVVLPSFSISDTGVVTEEMWWSRQCHWIRS